MTSINISDNANTNLNYSIKCHIETNPLNYSPMLKMTFNHLEMNKLTNCQQKQSLHSMIANIGR